MTSSKRPYRPYVTPSTKWRTRWLIAAALILGAVFMTACDVHGVATPGALASIVVTPNTTMAASTAQQMTAVGYDAEGRVVTIAPVWSIRASGGTINASGMFAAGSLSGVYPNTVVATVGGISGSASITVTPGPLATVVIVPNPVTLAVTSKQQFIAIGKDIAGNLVPFTPTWSVVASGGTIDQTGTFTAGGTPGTYTNTVQASSLGLTGFATVVVTVGPPASITLTPSPATLIVGAIQQFTAVAKDAGGNVLSAAFTWSLTAGGGTIDGGGKFTAGATPGTYTNTVRAVSGQLSASATVIVTAGPLATITVTPNPTSMPIGATRQFTAVGADVAGNPVSITPVWAVIAGGGTITTAGLFTAGTVAATYSNTIRASSGGVSGFATVTVTSGPLATITVTPNPVFMPANSQEQFVAVGRDASGNVFLMAPTWSVVNGGGTIAATTGIFTSGAAQGAFINTVKATSGSVSGTATVNVTAPPPPPSVVDLGAAAPNGIIAGTAVTCITGGVVNADVSISPGNTITGFGPCVITGVQNLANAAALAAQGSLTSAYNTLAGLPCPPANAIVANLGGTTKPAGVYCTASGISVSGVLTLDGGGDPNASFVFQAGTSLTTAGNIVLINGAQADNVFWQIGSSATLGTGSLFQGNILALTSITLVDNATLTGRALARNGAVSLGTNNIITLP